MVLGARTLDDKGCVLFYSSGDLESWKYGGTLSTPDFGYMWECPDLLDFDGHEYLSISPQGLEHGDTKFQNVYQSGYFRYDSGLKDFTEWDMGFDFYAPQTFVTPDAAAFSPIEKVRAVDTTGAGDGFIGSFLWKLQSLVVNAENISAAE